MHLTPIHAKQKGEYSHLRGCNGCMQHLVLPEVKYENDFFPICFWGMTKSVYKIIIIYMHSWAGMTLPSDVFDFTILDLYEKGAM